MKTAVFFNFQLNSSFMFGRTLFEYCVRKDTLHYVRKDTFHNISKTFETNSHLLNLKWSDYLNHVKRNPYISIICILLSNWFFGKGLKKRTDGQTDRITWILI